MIFAIVLALLGLFLIFLEFFFPKAILAVGGAALLIASLFAFHMTGPSVPLFIAYVIFLMGALFFVVKSALWRVKATNGRIRSYYDAKVQPQEWIGKVGLAASDLKPSGHICIENQTFKALSQEGHIGKGTPIEILGGQEGHWIVRPLENPPSLGSGKE